MSKLNFKKAVIGDESNISGLIKEAMLTYSRDSGIDPDILESMHESLETIKSRIVSQDCLCLFDENSKAVATITLSKIKVPSSFAFSEKSSAILNEYKSGIYISRFAVCDALRGTGLGVKLLDKTIKAAQKSGADCLILHTAISNVGMCDFYQKRGFIIADSENSRGYVRGLFVRAIKE